MCGRGSSAMRIILRLLGGGISALQRICEILHVNTNVIFEAQSVRFVSRFIILWLYIHSQLSVNYLLNKTFFIYILVI